jgi:hypothetical protein
MNLLAAIISLFIPIAAVYLIVNYCDRDAPSEFATRAFHLSLAVAIALGITSWGYFVWLFAVGPPGVLHHFCEIVAFAILGAGAWLARRGTPRAPTLASTPIPLAWRNTLIRLFVATLVLASCGCVVGYFDLPHGDWDAWAIWNQRARFLFRSGEDWPLAFSSSFPRNDYPLFVPCLNARLWSYLGEDACWSPWLMAMLILGSISGLLISGLCRLRDKTVGLLAGCVLLGSVFFLRNSTMQYADVPLSLFILVAMLLLAFYDHAKGENRRLLILVGLAAGLAAWTKNEGVLFFVSLIVARFVVILRRRGVRAAIGECLEIAIGALPILTAVVLQMVFLAGENDLFVAQGEGVTWMRLVAPSRWLCVVSALLTQPLGAVHLFTIVLPLLFFAFGTHKGHLRETSTVFVMLPLIFCGWCLVCVTTPYEIRWQMTVTMRLFSQIWPTILLALFLALNSPERRAQESEASLRGMAREALDAARGSCCGADDGTIKN